MPRRKLKPNEQIIIDSLRPAHRERIADVLTKLDDKWNWLLKDRRATPTGMVYHYTNQKGLDGITKYGTLWLNDYTTMSDTSEIKYGFDTGMRILREEYENGPKTGRLRRFVQGTEAAVRRGIGEYFHGYILSLTPKADELTQWEIYGNRARGFTLGFSGRTIDAAFNVFRKRTGIEAGGSFKVIYDDKRLRRMMRYHVRTVLDGVMLLNEEGRLNRQGSGTAMEWAGKQLIFAFIFSALFFKHPAYKHEDEYRYFVMTLPDNRIGGLKTRRGRKGRMIDYYEIDWKRWHAHALKQIGLGPLIGADQRRRTAARALRRGRLTADIVYSSIPEIDR